MNVKTQKIHIDEPRKSAHLHWWIRIAEESGLLVSKQVCARLPVFPFFSDDSDSVDSNDSGSIGIDSNDTVLLLIPVSSDDSLSATSSENSSWVLHASQDQTHPGLDWDGVSSLQVFDLST